MKRLPLSVLLLAVLILVTHFSAGSVGASVQCAGSNCLASASSSPLAIVLGVIGFIILLVIKTKSIAYTTNPSGFWRMVGALFLDLYLVVGILGAVLALPMLVGEQSYTGQFQWSFARQFSRPTDWLLIQPAALGSFTIILAIRVRAFVTQKPSFGQYLMGFVVLTEGQPPSIGLALKRFGWAALYLFIWPAYLIYKAVRNLPKHSWDARTNTKSVLFEYN